MSQSRVGEVVALRLPDPLGRRDAAGRAIPHEFVVLGPLADEVESVTSGLEIVWPLVAEVYAQVWDAEGPPCVSDLRLSLSRDDSIDGQGHPGDGT